MSRGTPEEVDIQFNVWFTRQQPLMDIAAAKGHRLTEEQWGEIRTALKRAWISAYAEGTAAEVARQIPR